MSVWPIGGTALLFGAATTDVVDIGSAAMLDNLDPFTLLLMVNVNTLTNQRNFYAKVGSNQKLLRLSGTTGDVQFAVTRAGGSTIYVTNTTPLSRLNTWVFLAGSYNSAAAAGKIMHIYAGINGAVASECTYGSTADGAGATDDSSGNARFGNNATTSAQGAIASGMLVNRELPLWEIVATQLFMAGLSQRLPPGAVAYFQFGQNGIGVQPDLTGNNNNGTVTGATVTQGTPWRRGLGRTIYSVPAGSGVSVLPGVGALTLTGFAPTISVSNNQNVLAGVGALTLTGFAPTIAAPASVLPGVGALTLTGFAPTVAAGASVLAGVGALSLAGFAPTITTSNNQLVAPGVGVLSLTGFAPTITAPCAVTPGVGLLTLTGFRPTISTGLAIVVGPRPFLLGARSHETTTLARSHETEAAARSTDTSLSSR